MALVSIVLPVYNGEKTIAETIQSVLGQNFSDFELLIIDDGSTDATLDIIAHFQDPKLKVFSYPNAGLAASRNRGIHLASGEFLSFIDADDLWTPDKIESQVKALQANLEAALAYSWTDYIDDSSHVFQSGMHVTASGNVLPKLLTSNFLENGSNALIRRGAFSEVGYFDESLKAAEDWDMYLRIAARFAFAVVPKVQILYRRTHSMSANICAQEEQTLKVLEKAFKKVPESLYPLKKQSLAQLYKYLTFKSFEGAKGWEQAKIATKCFVKAIKYNPALLLQVRLIASVCKKILKIALQQETSDDRVYQEVRESA